VLLAADVAADSAPLDCAAGADAVVPDPAPPCPAEPLELDALPVAWLAAPEAVDEACEPSLATLLAAGATRETAPCPSDEPEPAEAPLPSDEPVPCDDEPPAADEPPCEAAPAEPEPCDAAAPCEPEPDGSEADPLPDAPEPDADASLGDDVPDTLDASLTPEPFDEAEPALCADGSVPLAVVLELVESPVVLLPVETRSAAGCDAGSVEALLDGAGSDRAGSGDDDSVLPGACPWKPGVTLANSVRWRWW